MSSQKGTPGCRLPGLGEAVGESVYVNFTAIQFKKTKNKNQMKMNPLEQQLSKIHGAGRETRGGRESNA